MKTITLSIDAKKPYMEGQRVKLIDACRRESPITQSMEYFLATGNLVSRHGLGILQVHPFYGRFYVCLGIFTIEMRQL
jgi:hypothetical protein